MSRRAAGWLAWSLCALFAVLQLAEVWLAWRGPGGTEGLVGLMVGYAIVGALVASRQPHNAVGWLLTAIALVLAATTFGEVYVTDRSNPGYEAVGWLAGWVWLVWITLTAVFLPLVFPDGRLLSTRWRPVAWLAGVGLAMGVVGSAFQPGNLALNEPVRNPLAVHGVAAEALAVVTRTGGVLVGAAVLLAAASLVVRFRRARGVERQQLKWFAFVGLVILSGLALAALAEVIPWTWGDPVATAGWSTFLFGSLIGVPVATGIAILRHRLYDIDLVIKRTLVYGSLTALLVATYLGLVLVFRLVLSPATGDSDLAVAGSTLAVAALFRPLRSRIQSVVDRRFYRARYDAARTLEGFAVHLRDELDLETLGTDLRHVVHETMQPAHVSLWLRSAP